LRKAVAVEVNLAAVEPISAREPSVCGSVFFSRQIQHVMP